MRRCYGCHTFHFIIKKPELARAGSVTHSLIKKFLEKFSSIHTREVVADVEAQTL